jgi:phosphonate transport system substrate-binding protein
MDVLLAGPHVDQATIGKLREAFAKHGTEMIDSILAGGDENKKFKGMHWVTTVKDEDYNVVRRMYATIGQTQFSEFVGN